MTINFEAVLRKITRKQNLPSNLLRTRFRRCLTMWHIVFMAISNMIGAGLYKFSGEYIRDLTGPAIIISEALAGFTAVLSSMCYAEMESMMPVVGSVYSYSYVAIGEMWAFIVGWEVIFENTIGAAVLAKAWSAYLNVLVDNRIANASATYVGVIRDPTGITGNADPPDLVAAFLTVSISLLICLGARKSGNFNVFFGLVNLLAIVIIISYGMTFSNKENWTNPALCNASCLYANTTEIGCRTIDAFMPYGFKSVLKGAAKIYFAYIGFEAVTYAGEETLNPRKNLPRGSLLAVGTVCCIYIIMPCTLSLMLPYCQVPHESAYMKAFLEKSAWMSHVVNIGALSAFTGVLFGNLFTVPRVVNAMSEDGLFLQFFAPIDPKTKVPVRASIVFGFISALLALVFNVQVLVDMVIIGSLMGYSVVASCVILLRYNADVQAKVSRSITEAQRPSVGQFRKFLCLESAFGRIKSTNRIFVTILVSIPFCFGIATMINFASWSLVDLWWNILIVCLLALGFSLCLLFMYAHTPAHSKEYFRVPLFPLLPAVSLLVNIVLIIYLETVTWLRFVIWLVFGVLVYFAYGIHHSKENNPSVSINSVVEVVSPNWATIQQIPARNPVRPRARFSSDYIFPLKRNLENVTVMK